MMALDMWADHYAQHKGEELFEDDSFDLDALLEQAENDAWETVEEWHHDD